MKKKAYFIIPLIVFLFFSTCLLTQTPLLHWLELKTTDWRFLWRGPQKPKSNIVVVAIDEKSLHQEGRWPWPRQKMARLVEQLTQAQPAWMMMDIIFSEESSEDSELAQAVKKNNRSILGYYFYQNESELEKASLSPQKREESFQNILPSALPDISSLHSRLYTTLGVVSNTPLISQSAKSQGFFNVRADSDGVIRKIPLLLLYRNKIFPSMALETFSYVEGGFDPVPVLNNEGSLDGLSLGSRLIPTNHKGEVGINYRGGLEDYPIYSATDVLHGRVTSEQLKGKIVLLGATAIGIYDLRVTPISPNLPGILVQANLMDNLISGDFLVQNTWTRLSALGFMFLTTLFLGFLLPRTRIITGLLTTLFLASAYTLGSKILFDHSLVVPLAIPDLHLFTTTLGITIYRGLTEEREKKLIRTAFQSYLHPDLVKELTENLKSLKLGGQKTECTILFSDVRNFTSISEKMDPETLVELMNSYFDPVSKVIIAEGGYIDKFIGDAVMAIFGAPKKTTDHALRASRAALAMIKVVNELEPQFKEKYGIKAFRIGVGLNTGQVIVGNIGTKERLNYTVMGDNVNLASRLESANKDLGTEICMSESTYNQIKDQMQGRFISEISVKGKEEKIRVYELI